MTNRSSVVITDISFWQNDPTTPSSVNFDIMAMNADGVILRAGQNKWVDKDFKSYWSSSYGKLPRGSYWFYDSRVSPKDQANLWIDTLNGDFGELNHFADFEDRYGGPYGTWKHWYDFMEYCKVIPRLGIYTAYYYWKENTLGKGISKSQLDYFKQYPLWIAHYGVVKPLIPNPWDNWTLWQYTDNGDGSIYGVESKNIDLNHYNGSREDFNNNYGSIESSDRNSVVLSYKHGKAQYRRVK